MTLETLRKKIDAIDERIVALLNERYELAREVGNWKRGRAGAIYVPEREKTVLERLTKLNQGPMTEKSLRAIYREIMSGAIALESPLTVACAGSDISLTRVAAEGKFGANAAFQTDKSPREVFDDIATERVDYGVVPVENTLTGVINETLDALGDARVKICAEIHAANHYCLISRGSVKSITRVYGAEDVAKECSFWLDKQLPGVERVIELPLEDAAALARQDSGVALIGNAATAEKFDLSVLAANIENNANNITRFLVLGRQDTRPTGDDKTSVRALIENRAGALYDVFQPFKRCDIAITLLESRPSRERDWEYFFFIDFRGHAAEEKFANALLELEQLCVSVKRLGSYPRATEIL